MPLKDPIAYRCYMRTWVAKRRAAWFADKICAECGSRNSLEIHHLDRTTKKTSNVWSWSAQRREKELAKCIVLCHECHKKLTRKQKAEWTRKLNRADILDIQLFIESGVTQKDVARAFDVGTSLIERISAGRDHVARKGAYISSW